MRGGICARVIGLWLWTGLLAGACTAGGGPAQVTLPLYLPGGEPASGTPQEQARQVIQAAGAVLAGPELRGAVDLHFLDSQLADAIKVAPNGATAHRVLGRTFLEMVRYGEAKAEFSRALALDPHDSQARSGLREAARLSRLVLALPAPRGQRVFRLAEAPKRGGPSVAVLLGRWNAKGHELDAPAVRYYRRKSGRYHLTFRARLHTVLAAPAGAAAARDGIEYARIWVGDVQHTGRAQVLLVTGWIGADWLPAFVDVFEVAGRSLRPILHADSEDTPELVDLDRDRRPEVKVVHFFGYETSHAEQGARYDVYRYTGRRYVRANSHFRDFARSQLAEALAKLHKYPDDWDVLLHVAQAYRDLGQPSKAAPYERRAKALRAKPS